MAAAQKQKEVQAERDKLDHQEANTNLNNAAGGWMPFYGTKDQKEYAAAGLGQVQLQTGQNIYQTGEQNQDYLQSLQARRNGGDAVSEEMRGQRNRSMANMGRQYAGKGVAGGVAAAGMNSAQNTADTSIAAQEQKFGRQNDQDLYNYVKRMQKLNGEAVSQGEDKGLANDISVDTGSGIFGTVICTELHRQGILNDAIYELDKKFGSDLLAKDPYTFIGYCHIASPVVPYMAKSPLLTKAIAFWAVPWARQLAGVKSVRGAIVKGFGIPFCRMIGKSVVTNWSKANAV